MAEKSTTQKSKLITCRKILCLMIITCFMVHYMLRVNISIAIVDMVQNNQTHPNTTFQWTEHQKNDVLGCFFWGFLLTPLPGGRLSEIYGTRIVLGSAMLMASILTILTPLACYTHYYCVILARFALGLALGVSWPSIPPLAIKWVAPSNSAKFMSHTIACSVGAALTLPICGYIISDLGWPSVFYITGGISLVWSICWFYLVYDAPKKHPRISIEEKEKIENETEVGIVEEVGTPWIKILTSGPVWAIIIAETCLQFDVTVILNELPSYMDGVLGYNIRENGLLSSLPFFMTYIMAVWFTVLADKWRKTKKFSVIAIRKIFTGISFIIPSFLFVLQTIWGYDRTMSVFVFTLSQGFLAASTAGFIPNSMDISPLYSGTIFGLAFTGGAFMGIVSAKVVAAITSSGVTFEQWRYIFVISIGVNIFGNVFYHWFASADVQEWNPKNVNAVEMKKLNQESKSINNVEKSIQ